jgi:hypothetical protein
MTSRPPHSLVSRLRPAFAAVALIAATLRLPDTAHAGLIGTGAIAEQPLAPRSGPRGATMFVIVPPDESGVRTENKYDDPEMWGRRAREFDLGGIGTGVAIGDYDGDGRPDLFVVSKTETCRLFRNLGGWKFEEVTEKAGLTDVGTEARVWKQGATFADVNNDGRLDLYVCRFNAPNLLYINQGDGTFKEQAHAYGLDVKDASVMAAFGDYDRDGWLDVFVQTNVLDAVANPDGQRDYLFHNNRDGTFTNVSEPSGVAAGPTHGNSALWSDFDGDGWPDLYVANDFAIPDALYRNNHDGTFTNIIARTMPHAAYSSMGSDLGDVDNDGRLDLLVADMAASEHVKDQRTMAETRARMRVPPEGSEEIRQTPYSALYLDTGTGRFLEAGHLAGVASTDWTWSPRWEDLDNDGRADLWVTNGMYREIHNQDLINRRMNAGSPGMAGQVTKNSPMLAETHLAFRNLGDLQFENVAHAWGLDQHGVSFGSALGDLDGDGDLDLLYSNYQAGATLLRNDSDSGHRIVCALRGVRSNRFGIGAVVTIETTGGRQTRLLTLARGFMSSSEPIVHFGLGEATTIRRLTVTWPGGELQTFENLPADRRFTITEPADAMRTEPGQSINRATQFAETAASLHLNLTAAEEAFDEYLDQRLLPAGLNRRGPALAVAPLDGTGHDGICLGGTTRDALRLLQPKSGGGWTSLTAPALATPAAVDDGPVLLFDVAGRGFADLLVLAGGASQPADAPDYQPRLYLNDGHGQFAAAPAEALPPLTSSVGAACVADFDGDGRLDVFIGGRAVPGQYPTAPASALWVNRGGSFEDATDRVAPRLRKVGLVTGALWSDVDGDGRPDLLVTLDWGQVRYFHNQGGKQFEDWTDQAGFGAAGTGWWRSIAAADFNGDGRPDYAVGNVGLNTPYHADVQHPAVLFAGDFAGRGTLDLVEAMYEGDKLYPWRCRSDLGAAIPAVLRRYRSNNDYAKATLPEILGADRLAAATRLAATELRSGTFLSQADGTYRFEPLPRIAQISPAFGLVAGDFDGDGHADLYVVQNSYAPAVATGAADGGLSQLLRGDGKGGFTGVPPAESGLVVSGDAKALVVVDLDEDGWPDFLVSRNGASTLAWHNAGVAGRSSARVVLHGKAGNPQAIGARLTAEYADGSTQTTEVSAGSGYYSQSTAAQFFGSTGNNALRRIKVRWPGGTTSESTDFAGTPAPKIELTAP